MNSHTRFLGKAVALVCATLLLAGCWEDRVVWSPDGNRAAIITKEGLYLCDAEGRLSSLLAAGVYRAAWLPDSQRLVVARSRPIKDYAALAAALGPERTRVLLAKTEMLWQSFAAKPKMEISGSLGSGDDLGAIIVAVRAHHAEAMRQKLADEKERADFEAAAADWHSLVVARVVGDHLEFAPPITEGLASIHDIRPTPSGLAVAFVAPAELSLDNDGGLQLFVSPLDGSAPPSLLTTQVAAHPDWTPDSRTIVFFQAEANYSSGKPDEMRLGALLERDVLDAAGHVRLAGGTRELAGLIFQTENRVRSLRDGRVLFDAAEFHLPLAGNEHRAREQLFALDRATKSMTALIPKEELDRLPNPLSFFEIDPNGTAVLFGGGKDVAVLHLADGHVEHFAVNLVESKDGRNPPLPSWRRVGEFTYLQAGASRNELVLHQTGTETVLSRTWPKEVLQRLIE